jgi:FMN reductase
MTTGLGVSGGVSTPSRTTAVVTRVVERLSAEGLRSSGLIEVAEAARHLFRGLSRAELDATGEAIVQRIEAADVLVVGSPVYKGSYTGAFKHLFDFVDYRALTGKVVVLTATGGSALHGLMLEHQLRPLFGFFGAVSAPTTVFATPDDFAADGAPTPGLEARIARAARDVVRLLPAAEAPRARTAPVG